MARFGVLFVIYLVAFFIIFPPGQKENAFVAAIMVAGYLLVSPNYLAWTKESSLEAVKPNNYIWTSPARAASKRIFDICVE